MMNNLILIINKLQTTKNIQPEYPIKISEQCRIICDQIEKENEVEWQNYCRQYNINLYVGDSKKEIQPIQSSLTEEDYRWFGEISSR